MASLASTAVTVNARYKDTGAFGGQRLVVDATLAITAQGSIANPIPASLFGMQRIESVLSARGSDDIIYLPGVSYDGSKLTLCLVNGSTGAPADLSSKTVRCVVVGIEAFS